MTDAEQCSTAKRGAPYMARTGSRRWAGAVLTLAIVTGITSVVVAQTRPAGADQLSDAKAQAAQITAQIAQDEAQLQSLTNQVNADEYKISQLNDQIAAGQAQLKTDQDNVTKYEGQLQKQAINDYTHNGTTSQLGQMFSSDSNTTGIRNVYTTIAAGNVTSTIDSLHTAQVQLQAQQATLQQQQTQATAAANAVEAAKNQTSSLVSQKNSALNGVNSTIANLVAQQQAAAAAAAKKAALDAFNAKVAASAAAQAAAAKAAAQTAAATNSGGGGSGGGGGSNSSATVSAVSSAPLPPLPAGAAGAVAAAQHELGVPYLWGGATPAGFDCSGLVMWAYAQVGIDLPHFSGGQYDDTTHIPLSAMQPGDLLFYGPGGDDHVAMYIGGGTMVEAPYTGAWVHDTPVRTDGGFVGVGRVA